MAFSRMFPCIWTLVIDQSFGWGCGPEGKREIGELWIVESQSELTSFGVDRRSRVFLYFPNGGSSPGSPVDGQTELYGIRRIKLCA